MLIRISVSKLICIVFLAISTSITAQDGRKLDSIRFAAINKKDSSNLALMLDDQLYYIHSNGLIETKTEHLAHILTGYIVYDSIIIMKANYVRKSNYIIGTGLIRVKGIYSGSVFSVLLRFSNHYRRSRGHWRLLYWQSTKMTE